VRLRASTLPALRGRVRVPGYDRSALTPNLLHIGVGGFFRAHQAVYLDDLLHLDASGDWGYGGIGLLGQDARMHDVLRAQDSLYTILERDADGDSARVIGSMVEYLHAQDNAGRVLQRLSDPTTRIVSLTITEGGYYLDDATGEFNEQHPDIVYDLAHPHVPLCSFGYLAEALDRRRKLGIGPFTVMSCDNLQHNGDVARRTLLAYAERRDAGLHRWIAEHAAFPNSMVDRIVPATTPEHRATLAERFGIVDAWPVGTEPFRQWVVEDTFPGGRPAWDRVGVQFTSDVAPYEKMKMRLLNGSHQALCYIGLLLGHEHVHDAIADPDIRRLLGTIMDDEVTPLLPDLPGLDLAQYKRTLVERFANSTLADTLARIATDGSARMPKFVLPSIIEQLRRDGPIDGLCFTLAAWFHYLSGSDERGRPFDIVDALKSRLVTAAQASSADADALFDLDDLIDASLAKSPRVRSRVTAYLRGFREDGCRRTLARTLNSERQRNHHD
jgi:mannitol 2-dehydrogenase